MDLALRPIDQWPGARTADHRRQHSPFNSTYSATMQLLDRELRQLRAKRPVLMMDVTERDIRQDGQLRADARPPGPGVIVAFDSIHGPLKYACDAYYKWQDNLRAIALGLEALRRVERYGIATRGEQYTGWKQLGAGTVMGGRMTREEAARVLIDIAGPKWHGGDPSCVDAALDEDQYVRDCYRFAARYLHPDAGGDSDLFARFTAARDILLSPEPS